MTASGTATVSHQAAIHPAMARVAWASEVIPSGWGMSSRTTRTIGPVRIQRAR